MRLIDADDLRAEYQAILDRGDMFCEYDIIGMLDNAPTVEFPEQITIKCDTEEDKQKLLSALRNAKLKVLVEEDRPTGHWIETKEGVECSNCMRSFGDNPKGFTSWVKHNLHYCPKCGARMGAEND